MANANHTPDFASDEQFRYALGLQYGWSNAVTLGIAAEFVNSKSAPITVGGAVVGGVAGRRRSKAAKQAGQAEQTNSYQRAFAACMDGRGYSVK